MRTSKEALAVRIVARRTGIGAKPFAWEVYRADAIVPVYVSPVKFVSLAAAFEDGQAKLVDFIQKP